MWTNNYRDINIVVRMLFSSRLDPSHEYHSGSILVPSFGTWQSRKLMRSRAKKTHLAALGHAPHEPTTLPHFRIEDFINAMPHGGLQ